MTETLPFEPLVVESRNVEEPLSEVQEEIIRLKQEQNAVILAHNYQTPDIYHCVADFVGDSLQLALKARDTQAEIIVQAGYSECRGVHCKLRA